MLLFVFMTLNDHSMRISSEKKLLMNETALFFWKNIGNYTSDNRKQQLSAIQ